MGSQLLLIYLHYCPRNRPPHADRNTVMWMYTASGYIGWQVLSYNHPLILMRDSLSTWILGDQERSFVNRFRAHRIHDKGFRFRACRKTNRLDSTLPDASMYIAGSLTGTFVPFQWHHRFPPSLNILRPTVREIMVCRNLEAHMTHMTHSLWGAQALQREAEI